MKKIISILIALIFVTSNFQIALAESEPSIVADAAVLIDQTTGKVLYKKNENKRIYPASMTKVLTALVGLDYLKPGELIVAGNEVNTVPLDSSKAGIASGETLVTENLMRGLIIPSGSEAACVIAMEVARRETNNTAISYQNAEKVFCDLMNKKAQELGAEDSNFTNPHGAHNANHFTTAYDMALITQEAIKNPIIEQIASEVIFAGNGYGANPPSEIKTAEYSWPTRNLLLNSQEYSYPYATGLKTGFTDEAGYCLSATAKKGDKSLIAIICFSTEPERWEDAKVLFDYGFDNFNYEVIQEKDIVMGSIPLENFKLGDIEELEVRTNQEFGDIFSKEQVAAITHEIVYNADLIATNSIEGDTTVRLITPIKKDTPVAKITYTLEGEKIFEGELLTTRDVEERTFKTDVDYYFNKFKSMAFSVMAIPFWVAGVVIIFGIVKLISVFNRRKSNRYRRIRRRY